MGTGVATGGWLGIDFLESIGGRDCTLAEQVMFHTTCVESGAPGRIPNMGVTPSVAGRIRCSPT